jgi:spoIIIJ-associated protein
MGVALTVTVEESAEGTRINLEGEDGGVLVRRGGEGLQALQHIVATAFRKQLGDDNRIVIDCNGFRKDKDAELRQMARFVAEKAKSSGMPQEMGPLNPYERRIVHLAIAEDPTVTSESIGDAFLKTVIISTKR